MSEKKSELEILSMWVAIIGTPISVVLSIIPLIGVIRSPVSSTGGDALFRTIVGGAVTLVFLAILLSIHFRISDKRIVDGSLKGILYWFLSGLFFAGIFVLVECTFIAKNFGIESSATIYWVLVPIGIGAVFNLLAFFALHESD